MAWQDDEIVKPSSSWQDDPIVEPKVEAQVSERLYLPEDGKIKQDAIDAGAGAVRGAGSIGASVLFPVDVGKDLMQGKGLSIDSNMQRRKDMDEGLTSLVGANPESGIYQGAKLATELAGTGGVPKILSKLPALNNLPNVAKAVESSGLSLGGKTTGSLVKDMAIRSSGGALSAGGTVAAIDPAETGTAATLGAMLPVGVKGAHGAGEILGKGVASLVGKASPEVAALAERAKALGIPVPADRLVDSNAMNATASSLNYLPFSGRAQTEKAMESGLNKALSKTFGQDSANVTKALRDARPALGAEFERVLKTNTLKVDDQFVDDLIAVQGSLDELPLSDAKPIRAQIENILSGMKSGDFIEGKYAYSIKKKLDKMGQTNSNYKAYANDLKITLMDALNRSLGSEGAAKFATTRTQYRNMLTIDKLAKNGVEGEVSAARLGNIRGNLTPELQELADISAQFVRPREGQHGAAQRVVLGGTAAILGGSGAAIPAAGVLAAGRLANKGLNSEPLRNQILGLGNTAMSREPSRLIQKGALYAPVINAQ